MSPILEQAAAKAAGYLAEVNSRPVAPDVNALVRLAELGGPLPDLPTEAAGVIELLDRVGSPATVATSGGRFFGFVHGGTLPVALAANWLAGAWDQNAALYTSSPVASALEEISLGWLVGLLRLPADCGGAFVTGATMASFTGLAAARRRVLEAVGWDVDADGLQGAPAVSVVVSEEVHPSVLKSLGLLGLGRRRVLRVPVDGQGRMRADALPDFEAPAIVCVQVGNVNTGASDQVGAICDAAHARGAWVHVDGAFGLWAAASPALSHLVAGVEKADSWATDAHKWLNVPYDSGLAFVRDPELLYHAMSVAASYIPLAEHRDPGLFTPELSRRARGVEIRAALRTLGRNGVAAMIERTCRHARRMADGLRAADCQVLNEVVLNQVLVSFGDAETTSRVIDIIQDQGVCWCGGTTWQGHAAMRVSVANWSTSDEDVERSLEAILEARRLASA
ncbi:MAG: pyridoxal-dependent decarboxylase [Bryobacteraceae bacterium]